MDIFFVISGFVMYASSYHLQHKHNGWIEFATKRLVRIVPLYWAVTSLKLIILLTAPQVVLHSQLDWTYILKSYLFIPAYNVDGNIEPLLGVGWTLTFEMFFYAVFALALLFRAPILPTLSAVMVGCALASLLRKPDWPVWSVYFDIRVLEFLSGALIAKYFSATERPLWFGIAVTALGFGLIFLAPGSRTGIFSIFTLVLPATLVVLGVVSLEPHLKRFFPNWLVLLGAASYSLYLIHPIVAPAAPAILNRLHLRIWPLSIAASVGIAILSSLFIYFAFEKPVTRSVSKILKSKSGQS